MELNEHHKPVASALLKLRLEGKSGIKEDVTLVKDMLGPKMNTLDLVELASWTFDVDHEDLAGGMTIQEVATKYGLNIAG